MSELDDLFKEAAQSEQATFKPEYWEQYADQYINQNQDQNTSFGLFWTEIGLLGVFLISILYFGLKTADNQISSDKVIAKNELATQAISPVSLEENETKTASLETAGVESLQMKNVEKGNSESAVINNAKRTVSAVSDLSIGNKKPVKRSANDLFAKKQNGQVANKTDFALDNNLAEVVVPTNEKREEVTKGSERIQKETFAEATQPEYLVATVVDDSTERPSELVEEKEESNQEVNAEYDNENSENTGMNSVPDSAEAPQKEVSEVTRSRVKKLQFAAQFGLIAYDDFDLSSPSFDVKTGMFFGLEAEYLLSSSFSVSVGANVYNRQSDNLIIAFDEQDKGFGKIRNRKTYSYTNLYFLEAPITLNYNINAKHKIGAGPTFTRLLTTKVEVNEEFPAASSANESEYMYHYNTFNLNNVGINLNYQYLFGRVGINVGYTQGINEFLNKETFKSSGFSNLSRVNFAIKYRL